MKEYKYTKDFTFEGHRFKVRANTLEELYDKKAKKIAELKSRSRILSPSTTVDDWSKVAYDTYKSNVKDLPNMKRRYSKYVSPQIGHIQISKVRAIQCQAILNSCSGMSFSHVTKLRQELKFLFSSALDNKLISDDPTKRLTLPSFQKGSRRSITDHERKHLYSVYEGYRPFILFIIMLETGCRPAEAAGLIGKDIDHKNRLLHIRGTKTVNSDRFVPIPDRLYEDIKDTKPFDYICHHDRSSYRRLRERLYREMNISMGAKTYRNALVPPLPLAEDFTPYCLRHTYCTDLCKASVDVRTAQKLMGHANISITSDIYTHVDQSEILKAAEKIRNYQATTLPTTPTAKNA